MGLGVGVGVSILQTQNYYMQNRCLNPASSDSQTGPLSGGSLGFPALLLRNHCPASVIQNQKTSSARHRDPEWVSGGWESQKGAPQA